jgi:hypothetical protein
MNANAIYPIHPGQPGDERHLRSKDLDRACGAVEDPGLPLACNEDECFVTTSELESGGVPARDARER